MTQRYSSIRVKILQSGTVHDCSPERWLKMDAEDATAQLEAAIAAHNAQAAEIKQVSAELGLHRESVRQGLARRDCLDNLESRYRTLAAQKAQWPERIAALEVRHRAALERLGAWRRGRG